MRGTVLAALICTGVSEVLEVTPHGDVDPHPVQLQMSGRASATAGGKIAPQQALVVKGGRAFVEDHASTAPHEGTHNAARSFSPSRSMKARSVPQRREGQVPMHAPAHEVEKRLEQVAQPSAGFLARSGGSFHQMMLQSPCSLLASLGRKALPAKRPWPDSDFSLLDKIVFGPWSGEPSSLLRELFVCFVAAIVLQAALMWCLTPPQHAVRQLVRKSERK